MAAELRTLVELSRTLGDPSRDLVILAEGNTSIRTEEDRMLVKASGSQLGTAADEDFVEVNTATMLDLVNDEAAGEKDVERVFGELGRSGKRPSVEAMLHAICLSAGGASVVGHTHPVPVNIVLCSPHAQRLSSDVLFPEQVVILGRNPAFVPYLDPGLTLARAVQREMRRRIELDDRLRGSGVRRDGRPGQIEVLRLVGGLANEATRLDRISGHGVRSHHQHLPVQQPPAIRFPQDRACLFGQHRQSKRAAEPCALLQRPAAGLDPRLQARLFLAVRGEARFDLRRPRAKAPAVAASARDLIEVGASVDLFSAKVVGKGGERPLGLDPDPVMLFQVDQGPGLLVGKRVHSGHGLSHKIGRIE